MFWWLDISNFVLWFYIYDVLWWYIIEDMQQWLIGMLSLIVYNFYNASCPDHSSQTVVAHDITALELKPLKVSV